MIEFLWQCRMRLREIRWKEDRRDALRASIEQARALPLSFDGIGAKFDADPIGNRLAEIMEIEAEIDRLHAGFAEARRMIYTLPDPIQQRVLEMYYLTRRPSGPRALHTWRTVAVELGYAERHVRRIHTNAIQKLEKLFEKK